MEFFLEQPTYQPIPLDPTNKYKTKLLNILKRIQRESGMDDTTCKRMYSTAASFLGFTVYIKDTKRTHPSVSVSYGFAKQLAGILQLLVGNSLQHIQNTKDCTEQVKNITLEVGECITSYNVTSLHLHPSLSSSQHNTEQTRAEQDTTTKGQTYSISHHRTFQGQ